MANYKNTYNEIYNAMCDIEEILEQITSYDDYKEQLDDIQKNLHKIQLAIDLEYDNKKELADVLGNLSKELI